MTERTDLSYCKTGGIHGETYFVSVDGLVHSDICADPVTDRVMLHSMLDEWLDRQTDESKSCFYLGSVEALYAPDDHVFSALLTDGPARVISWAVDDFASRLRRLEQENVRLKQEMQEMDAPIAFSLTGMSPPSIDVTT